MQFSLETLYWAPYFAFLCTGFFTSQMAQPARRKRLFTDAEKGLITALFVSLHEFIQRGLDEETHLRLFSWLMVVMATQIGYRVFVPQTTDQSIKEE